MKKYLKKMENILLVKQEIENINKKINFLNEVNCRYENYLEILQTLAEKEIALKEEVSQNV